jgi:hypothetical protein
LLGQWQEQFDGFMIG